MTDDIVKRLRANASWGDDRFAEAADHIKVVTAERDRLREDLEELDFLRHEGGPDSVAAIEAERDRLREAMDYILDGMGIAEPDYDIDPDDDFLDAANSEWVRDTLTRLAAALKGEAK